MMLGYIYHHFNVPIIYILFVILVPLLHRLKAVWHAGVWYFVSEQNADYLSTWTNLIDASVIR